MIACLTALALGAAGAFAVSLFGSRLGLLDHPKARSSHSKAIAKGGGIGIAAAFLVTALRAPLPPAFWLPLTILAGLALLGDIVEIPPRLRLPGQVVLAGIVVAGAAGGFSPGPAGILKDLGWIVFIVGTANFYNFMDGIDGIAGITGAVAFGLLAVETAAARPEIGLLAACMASACLGFLPFNLPRARVFMGDVGSILLGAAFAGLVFLASRTWTDVLCLSSLLLPFYADELGTMFVRLRSGEDLTRPHRRHVYQLLANEWGLPHGRIAAGYGLLQIAAAVSVLAVKRSGPAAAAAVAAAWLGLFILGGAWIRRRTARTHLST